MGANTMTGEQKSLLIYGARAQRRTQQRRSPATSLPALCADVASGAGSLAAFFALFISGYLLD
jgi:hypothetical protein